MLKLYQNRSINKGARAMKKFFFSKNSNFGLDRPNGPTTLKGSLVKDIVTLNIFATLNQNWLMKLQER